MDAFEILADPRRRAIVELLSRRDRTVGEWCELEATHVECNKNRSGSQREQKRTAQR